MFLTGFIDYLLFRRAEQKLDPDPASVLKQFTFINENWTGWDLARMKDELHRLVEMIRQPRPKSEFEKHIRALIDMKARLAKFEHRRQHELHNTLTYGQAVGLAILLINVVHRQVSDGETIRVIDTQIESALEDH